EGVFEESRRVSLAEQPSSGGLVVAEEELTRPLELKLVGAQLSVRYNDAALTVGGERRLAGVFEPGPGVAEPHLRQHVEARRHRTPVDDGDAPQHVLDVRFRVLNLDVEVAVVVEEPGVDQLELRVLTAAARVLVDELLVGIRGLRILVEHPRVRAGRGRIDRKSTRLNSSHDQISYAVFCLK